jgi:hypothetical protein
VLFFVFFFLTSENLPENELKFFKCGKKESDFEGFQLPEVCKKMQKIISGIFNCVARNIEG